MSIPYSKKHCRVAWHVFVSMERGGGKLRKALEEGGYRWRWVIRYCEARGWKIPTKIHRHV